ncbi:hypothetical protein AAY473_008971 [Plecturocebus cupreus]
MEEERLNFIQKVEFPRRTVRRSECRKIPKESLRMNTYGDGGSRIRQTERLAVMQSQTSAEPMGNSETGMALQSYSQLEHKPGLYSFPFDQSSSFNCETLDKNQRLPAETTKNTLAVELLNPSTYKSLHHKMGVRRPGTVAHTLEGRAVQEQSNKPFNKDLWFLLCASLSSRRWDRNWEINSSRSPGNQLSRRSVTEIALSLALTIHSPCEAADIEISSRAQRASPIHVLMDEGPYEVATKIAA